MLGLVGFRVSALGLFGLKVCRAPVFSFRVAGFRVVGFVGFRVVVLQRIVYWFTARVNETLNR